MKRCFGIVTFFALVMYVSGCATIFKGTSETVNFSSDPSDATVYINGSPSGMTPMQTRLESKKTYRIEFKKAGYRSGTFMISNSVGGGWVVLDVLGGLLPVIIDAATGAFYYLDQTHVHTVLEKK